MMFLEFFIWGSWYVTVGNYMASAGMTSAIPWAYTVHPLGSIVSPFFLGMVADRFFATEKVLGVAAILMGLYSFTLPHTPPQLAGTRPTAREIIGLDALSRLSSRPFWVFIVSSLLICIPLSAYA